MDKETETDGPLERYLRLLEIIAAFPDKLTLVDVTALSGLPKASAHRLLKGLVKAGMATGGSGGLAYSIGPRLSRILHATADAGWLEVLARPILTKLAETSGEACYLTKLVGNRVLIAVSQAPEVRWRSYVQPGIEMPPHATATGKAIMAFQSEEMITHVLASDLPILTANTRNDAPWIREEYARVRERGYATCIGEVDEGLAAIAAPVRLHDESVLYSVGLSGPLPRIMGERNDAHLAALMESSNALRNLLSIGTAWAPENMSKQSS